MEQSKAPDARPSEEWAALPWRKLEQHLYHLQQRIFKASARGDLKAVHKLQKLLLKSRPARLVAVRRVTEGTTRARKPPGSMESNRSHLPEDLP